MIPMIIVLLIAFSDPVVDAKEAQSLSGQPISEIKILFSYEELSGKYTSILVSTPDRLISAGYLFPDNGPIKNGACFNGDAHRAAKLFERMIKLMNEQNKTYTPTTVRVEYNWETVTRYLKVDYVDKYGRSLVWFPRIRECLNWSTPEERDFEPEPAD